ncbi:hypothetical protein BO82DRAFT_397293 [Aspergillus uvarum CBS 121591]|uniref:Uncharacterized protein n=1 Tax=Aspergillus uvarum CBS 121591 TaxID=1448315 RepID=A0A319E6M7_9EURO|nr:hypothetical protein BO82DRAFT_397293 [Aspergillus uvarum CBS 121591]PYH86712.1 hypothetical protein BO82DRAFT_397293 [Aspergillus uvarum CBS 121591]
MSSSAWPRPSGTKHILLLATGCPADAGPTKERLARDLAIQAPFSVLGEDAEVHALQNGFKDYHDATKIWGPHFARLQVLRRWYDPCARSKGAIGVQNDSDWGCYPRNMWSSIISRS